MNGRTPPARYILALTLHAGIEDLCDEVIERAATDYAGVFYPPEHAKTPTTGFLKPERELLQVMADQPAGRSALRKLTADIAGRTLQFLFTILDGVVDPDAEWCDGATWPGMRLVERASDEPDDRGMYMHDFFLATYSDYIRKRGESAQLE